MKNQKIIPSIQQIKTMSYTDFVGLINQWNVLPGAHSTLSKWAVFSQMNLKSRLLEMACTTGFSSRELAIMTGCEAVGIDISALSIESAKKNLKQYAHNHLNIQYQVHDACYYASSKKFSHIAVGASLKFFDQPELAIKNIIKLLKPNGFLLASPFYVSKEIPRSVVVKFKKIFNIAPTNDDYKKIMSLYSGFEIIYEDRCDLVQETKNELAHYCKSTTDRAVEDLDIKNHKDIYKVIYDKLYSIKEMSNELRPYQRYSVLVLRYRPEIYPKRYVELF